MEQCVLEETRKYNGSILELNRNDDHDDNQELNKTTISGRCISFTMLKGRYNIGIYLVSKDYLR